MALQVWLPLNKNGADKNQGLANISVDNSAIYSDSGKLGGCYFYKDDLCQSFNNNLTSIIGEKRSICVWVKPAGNHIHYTGAIVSSGNWNSSNWTFGVNSNNTGVTGFGSGYSTYLSCNVPVNEWTHLTCVTNGTHHDIYKNGSYIGSLTSGDSLLYSDASNTTIGRETYAGGYFGFNGYINDVRIYDHCLSPKEVKEIAKGLVLHYPLNDAYVEGTSNLFSVDLTYHTNWNNSGSATWNWNDNTIPKINNSIIYSISRTDTGNSAIGCGRCKLVAGKTYTASVYVYLSGNVDSNVFYIRSVDTHVATLKYNNDTNPQKWPQNQWIRTTATFTTSKEYNSCYVFTYLDKANSKRALTCWQIEEKDHATPYTPNTRNETTVYDCSGYQNNGTITGSLSCSGDSPRYKISTHFTSSIPSRIMLPSDMSCLSGNNEQTLSCWVKSSGLGSGMSQSGLIALGYGNSLFLSDSDYCYRIDNGTSLNSILANQNPHDGKWHLVTATYKSGVASIYIDGILKNSMSRTFSNRYINNGGNCIGTEANSPSVYNINGDISDVRMYTTALPAEDIKELYNTSCIINS